LFLVQRKELLKDLTSWNDLKSVLMKTTIEPLKEINFIRIILLEIKPGFLIHQIVKNETLNLN
jgi:hypothetical protein